ncbi:unnamed protein product, partial [Ixodes pacificus]
SSVGKCRQQLLTHGRWQRRPLSRRFSRTPEKLNPAMHRHTTQVKHTTHSITKHRAARHGESCGTRVVSCFSFLFLFRGASDKSRRREGGKEAPQSSLGGGSGASERGRLPGSRHDFRSFQRHIRPTTEMILPPCLRTGMAVVKAAAAAD